MDETLDQLVRRVDEDRWLASRFAPEPARVRLITLYTLNYEIARTAEAVSNPALGDIRLAWWAEAVEEMYSGGKVRAYPALQAYKQAVSACGLPRAPLDAIITARSKDLDAAPFASWDDLDAYLNATAGNLILLAMSCLLGRESLTPAMRALAQHAGTAWGYCGLMRAAEFWRARGRSFAPTGLQNDEQKLRGAMLARAQAAYAEARRLAPVVHANVFSTFGYVAFCKGYLAKLESGQAEQTPLLRRQASLVWASATGRI